MTLDVEHEVEFHFVPASDVALYVAKGALDVGLAPSHTLETQAEASECSTLLELPLASTQIVGLVLAGSAVTALTADHVIATPFPELVQRKLPGAKTLRVARGSLLALHSGIADALVDSLDAVPSSDRSSMRVVGPKWLSSSLSVVARETVTAHDRRIHFFTDVLSRKTKAMRCVKVQCQLPRTALGEKLIEEHGFIAMPLLDQAWVRIEAVVADKIIASLSDALQALGAKSLSVVAVLF